MSIDEYAALPAALRVRELRYTVRVPGRRTRVVTIATTLLDPKHYPAADVAALYGQRWQIEISHPNYLSSESLYRGGVAA